jgi:hypothetical protein
LVATVHPLDDPVAEAGVLERPARDARDRDDAGRLAVGRDQETLEPVGGPLLLERPELAALRRRGREPVRPGRVERLEERAILGIHRRQGVGVVHVKGTDSYGG